MSNFLFYLDGWSTFYVALVGVTAVLMGLVFLAVSLRRDLFARSGLHEPREVAWQTFINFFWVFVVSLMFLIPGWSATAFAAVLTALNVIGVFLVARRWRRVHKKLSRSRSIVAFLPLLLVYLVLTTGSVWCFFDFHSLVAIAPALVFLVGIAVTDAWKLLFAYQRPDEGS